jgi:hypothetical protein
MVAVELLEVQKGKQVSVQLQGHMLQNMEVVVRLVVHILRCLLGAYGL